MTKQELKKVQEYLKEQLRIIECVKENGDNPTANEYIVQGILRTLYLCGYEALEFDDELRIVKM